MEKSRRAEKREKAAHHDSGRYLKKHLRNRSDPLTGLAKEDTWKKEVDAAVKKYPKLHMREVADRAAGGLKSGRRGPSPEAVLMRHSSKVVGAVEKAMRNVPREKRGQLAAILWHGAKPQEEDRKTLKLFFGLTAVYLGFGDPYWSEV